MSLALSRAAMASARQTGTIFAGLHFAYRESVRADLFPVKSLHGCSRAFRRDHGDDPVTARSVSCAIHGEIDLDDIAVDREQIHEILVCRGGSKIVYV